MSVRRPNAEASAVKGWLRAHKWLLLRRCVQLALLAVFLLGPLASIWIVKGNLASSNTLGVLSLTDPFVLLQSLFAGHRPGRLALVGAALVLAFYAVVGGRVFCAWVCPVNLVTDGAAGLRRRLGIHASAHLSRRMRYALLVLVCLLAAATGTLAWELVNPVSLLARGLLFGLGAGWMLILAIFFFDLFVVKNGWCGHLCPMGAFYSLPGKVSLVRTAAVRRSACNDCMDCYVICPEPQVIRPALKGLGGAGPAILAGNCLNCGRCIDVCAQDVFALTTRFAREQQA